MGGAGPDSGPDSGPERRLKRGLNIMDEKTARIVDANCNRVREAIRVIEDVLEEVSKLADPALSRRFKRSRFRVYELEKSCLLAVEGGSGRD